MLSLPVQHGGAELPLGRLTGVAWRTQPQSGGLQFSLWTPKLIPQPLHQPSSPSAGSEPAGTLPAPAALIELCRINLWN